MATDYVTQASLERTLNEAIDDMAEIVSGFAQQIADKLAVADVRFDMIEGQLAMIADELAKYHSDASVLRQELSGVQVSLSTLRQFVRRLSRPITSRPKPVKTGRQTNYPVGLFSQTKQPKPLIVGQL